MKTLKDKLTRLRNFFYNKVRIGDRRQVTILGFINMNYRLNKRAILTRVIFPCQNFKAPVVDYEKLQSIIADEVRLGKERIDYAALRNIIAEEVRSAQEIRELHQQTFPPFKNKHQGQDVVIVATGPTLNDYVPIENAIHIGVNNAVLCDRVKLDYLFTVDYLAVKNNMEALNNYDCTKFYGKYINREILYCNEHGQSFLIPESDAIKANAHRFYCDYPRTFHIYDDISCNPLAAMGSIAFCAINFAFYTNPKRIYLVGCDCSTGHFNKSKSVDLSILIDIWIKIKTFRDIYYPDTQIISVNPIGLKGMFDDVSSK